MGSLYDALRLGDQEVKWETAIRYLVISFDKKSLSINSQVEHALVQTHATLAMLSLRLPLRTKMGVYKTS